MENQIKAIQNLADNIDKKSNFLSPNKVIDEIYEVFSECCLIVQNLLSIELGSAMNKLFNILKEVVEKSIKIEKTPQEAAQIVIQPQIPKFINQLQVSSVSIMSDYGISQQVNNIKQIPWSQYKTKSQQPKSLRIMRDATTSTLQDYYDECRNAINSFSSQNRELDELLEYIDDTIAILNEALANKKQIDAEYHGKPQDLDLAISDIHFRRLHLEQALKQANLDQMTIQNFDHVVNSLQSHIQEVQKQTAAAIMKQFKKKLHDQERKLTILNDMKTKVKQKIITKNECTMCPIYVNDIMQLKTKQESLLLELQKNQQKIIEYELQIHQKEIQYKQTKEQITQLENEKMEFKLKFDNVNREYSKILQKKNSEQMYVSQSSYDDNQQQSLQKSTIIKEPIIPSTKQIYLSPKDTYNYQKKTYQMERLIKLVNVLDSNNQTKRLSQMQYILEQRQSTQVNELADLIKQIEEVDLQINNQEISYQRRLKSATNLDYNNDISDMQRRMTLQTSFEAQINEKEPIVKIQIPNENQNFNLLSSSRILSPSIKKPQVTIENNDKDINQNMNLTAQYNQSNANLSNQSPNLLSPHAPMIKAKSSSNLKLQRDTPSQQNTQINSFQAKKQTQILQNNNVKVNSQRVIQQNIEEYTQTEYNQQEKQTQTENTFSRQVSEFLEGSKINNFISKSESQQLLTTASSTFHFGNNNGQTQKMLDSPQLPTNEMKRHLSNKSNQSESSLAIGLINSKPNSNLPSPRSKQSTKHQQINSPSNYSTFTSPNSQRQFLSSIRSESEQSQIISNKVNTLQQDIAQSSNKLLKDRIYDQQKEKFQSKHRRMYTSGQSQSNNTPRDQFVQDEETVARLLNSKIEEERLLFEEGLNTIPDSIEQEIIQKALTRQPGYQLSSELNDKILQTMYEHLNTQPEIQELIKKINGDVNLITFKKFIRKMQIVHNGCGKDCVHLMRLGFVNTKYLNKRKQIKLGKPKVIPGFNNN